MYFSALENFMNGNFIKLDSFLGEKLAALGMPILASGGGLAFFKEGVNTLKIIVMALGAGLGAWGVVNLLEGYGNDNPGAKSQGIKQLMAGGGLVLIGMKLIPLLGDLLG